MPATVSAMEEKIKQELFQKVKPVYHLRDFIKYLGASLTYKPDPETVFIGLGWELSFDMVGERIVLGHDHIATPEFIERYGDREIINIILEVWFDFYNEADGVDIYFNLPEHQDLLSLKNEPVCIANNYYMLLRNILWHLKQTSEKRAKYLTPPDPKDVLAKRAKASGRS